MSHPYRVAWRPRGGSLYRDRSGTLERAVRIRDQVRAAGCTARIQVLEDGTYRDMSDTEVRESTLPR